MKIGYIGLGKMGYNMVLRLLEQKWEVVVSNKTVKEVEELAGKGAIPAKSVQGLVQALTPPRLIWLMVPYQAVDEVIGELLSYLQKGDTLIDGGNSPYKESMRRAKELEEKGIDFLDVGTSGGPGGARSGACCMIGGKEEVFEKFEKLFQAISAKDAYGYMGESGAGHFVKMVHNGIEYGMMQSLAEGFEIMKKVPFDLSLEKVADLYNHRSVVESRLVGWLKDGYAKHGQELKGISGSVEQGGEGMWTVETAKELGVNAPIIEGAVNFRAQSQKDPSYAGKVLSLLRNQFGGHEVKEK